MLFLLLHAFSQSGDDFKIIAQRCRYGYCRFSMHVLLLAKGKNLIEIIWNGEAQRATYGMGMQENSAKALEQNP